MSTNNDWGLTHQGCLGRQNRLRDALKRHGVDAAVVSQAHHVYYLSNLYAPSLYTPILVVSANGPAVMALGYEPEAAPFVEQVERYDANRRATFIEDQVAAGFAALAKHLPSGWKRVATDLPLTKAPSFRGVETADLRAILLGLRRRKDADELTVIRHAIAATEAVYDRARTWLEPGMTELQMYARLYKEAVEAAGEPITFFGNDFQSGTPGGAPRHRPMNAGELVPLDLSIGIKGYISDMCRTFAIGRKPTDAQLEARDKVLAAIRHVEQTARAGVSCRKLYQDVFQMIDGHKGWQFFHHLGHGIGLEPHEAPRLNPDWDDTLQVGDVFTVEPGLYADELAGGPRIEENYLVTDAGLTKLTSCSTEYV